MFPLKNNDQIPQQNNSILSKKNIQDGQIIIYFYVVGCIIISYLLGLFYFSLIWIFSLTFLLFYVWYKRVLGLTEEYIFEKELLMRRRKASKNEESAEWLNYVINRWWMFCSDSISDEIKKKLNPTINKSKPSYLKSLEIEKVCFGTKTPFLGSIQVYELDNKGGGKKVELTNWDFPMEGLKMVRKMQLICEFQLETRSQQFLQMKTKFRGLGLTANISVEDLYLKSRTQMIVNFDTEQPFPHISSLAFCFLEKPEVQFSIKLLRHLQITEIPLFKTWLNKIIISWLTDIMVDPGKLVVEMGQINSMVKVSDKNIPAKFAQGVIIISLRGDYINDAKRKNNNAFDLLEENHYCELSLFDECLKSQQTKGLRSFTHSGSFLVYDLKKDVLKIRVFREILFAHQTLAFFEIPISKYEFQEKNSFTINFEQKLNISKTSQDKLILSIDLSYQSLPNIERILSQGFDMPLDWKPSERGIVHVCLHGASDLSGSDRNGLLNPYCIVYNGKKKITWTHYVSKSRNPTWQTNFQFITKNISKTVLSFVIYDWDGRDSNDNDYLGSTQFMINQENPICLNQFLPLNSHLSLINNTNNLNFSINNGSLSTFNNNYNKTSMSSVIVSTIFIPILDLKFPVKANNSSYKESEERENCNESICLNSSQLLSMEFQNISKDGIIEINVIQAKDLIPKDRNGLNDPFYEIFVNKQKCFTSKVEKKTLNPVWNEQTFLELPKKESYLEINVWDYDKYTKSDFLGSLSFNRNQIEQISDNKEIDGWYCLDKTPMGMIQLALRVIKKNEEPLTPISMDSKISNYLKLANNLKEENIKQANGENVLNDTDKTISDAEVHSNSEVFNQQTSNCVDAATPNMNRSRTSSETSYVKCLSKTDKGLSPIQKLRNLTKATLPKFASSVDVSSSSYDMYMGVEIEVFLIKGLMTSTVHAVCKIKLYSVIARRQKKTIAKSSQFVPIDNLLMNLKFQVDNGFGESKESLLGFSIKSGFFNNLASGVVFLRDLLPSESKIKKESIIDLGSGISIYLNASYERMQLGYNIAQKNTKGILKSRVFPFSRIKTRLSGDHIQRNLENGGIKEEQNDLIYTKL